MPQLSTSAPWLYGSSIHPVIWKHGFDSHYFVSMLVTLGGGGGGVSCHIQATAVYEYVQL